MSKNEPKRPFTRHEVHDEENQICTEWLQELTGILICLDANMNMVLDESMKLLRGTGE